MQKEHKKVVETIKQEFDYKKRHIIFSLNKFSISSSSIVPNSSLILIIIDKPKALVATPTTIAVRIKT